MSEPEPVIAWQRTVVSPDGVIMEINESDPEQLLVWSETEPAAEPATVLDAVRQVAWHIMAIPRNPEAALFKYAQRRDFGAPLTNEFDFTFEGVAYRGQGYAMGIVYAEVDDWGHIWAVLW